MKPADEQALRGDLAKLRRQLERAGEENNAACDRVYRLEAVVRALLASRSSARAERDIARRQLAALQASAQRAARSGQGEALAAELPEAWRAAS